MITFTGRIDHTIKIKNKPIAQGFKVWYLAEKGYIWSCLWHSGENAVEDIPQKFRGLNPLSFSFYLACTNVRISHPSCATSGRFSSFSSGLLSIS